MSMVLQDFFKGESLYLEHENKKLKWTTLPNGNYLLANRSPVRPIRYEFSPEAMVRLVDRDTRLGEFVCISPVRGRRFIFTVKRQGGD